jgi:hypothetical protein
MGFIVLKKSICTFGTLKEKLGFEKKYGFGLKIYVDDKSRPCFFSYSIS